MDRDDLQREFETLQARLARIEKHLELPPPPPEDAPEVAREADAELPPEVSPVLPEIPPTPLVSPPTPATPPSSLVVPPTLPPVVVSAPPVPQGQGLEMMIGIKGTAWIGAVVIMIGGAFFIRLGFQEGWWAAITPAMRCVIISGFGLLLLGGGEYAIRKINTAASVGLFGAGIGTLYLDAFATFRFFDLLSREMAFVLMGLVAVGGFAITLRTRFRTIGVLSLLGGYGTPYLLQGSSTHDLELLSYLTVLFAIALGLSAARPLVFRSLRFLALAGQMLIGLSWLVSNGSRHWEMAIVFLSIWWVMVLAEAVFAALRNQSAKGNVVATVLASAGYVTAGAWILNWWAPAGPDWLGGFMLMIGLLCAAAALQFGPGWDGLRRAPRDAMDMLAIALWVQFAVLITTAIAMHFDGYGASIGWLVLGLGAVEIGRRMGSRGVSWFGLIVGGLATGRVFTLDLYFGSFPAWSQTIGPVTLNGWSILAVVTVGAIVGAALRVGLHRIKLQRGVAMVLMGAAAILWMYVCGLCCTGAAITGGWLMGAGLLLATERFGRRAGFLEIAFLMLAVSAGRWLVVDALGNRLGPDWDAMAAVPLVNSQMGLLVATLVITGWGLWLTQRRAAENSEAATLNTEIMVFPVVMGILLLLGLSFEVERVLDRWESTANWVSVWPSGQLRMLWLTGLWVAGSAVMMGMGRWKNHLGLLGTGWVLMIIMACFWLVPDTLRWRFSSHGVAETIVLVNLQGIMGVGCGVGLIAAIRLGRGLFVPGEDAVFDGLTFRNVSYGLIGALGLWIGSLEIDRGLAETATAVQAGLSIYWSLYGVLLVVIGFGVRSSAARQVGLGLLAITVVKVVAVDLSQVDHIWRVLSFIASGLLLIGTSVMYSKLAPRLLEPGDNDAPDVEG